MATFLYLVICRKRDSPNEIDSVENHSICWRWMCFWNWCCQLLDLTIVNNLWFLWWTQLPDLGFPNFMILEQLEGRKQCIFKLPVEYIPDFVWEMYNFSSILKIISLHPSSWNSILSILNFHLCRKINVGPGF